MIDVGLGIKTSCELCPWVSNSYPYGTSGQTQAEDELSEHQIHDHPRGSDGVRLGVYMDEPQ
jgi:hypothetical protein